MDGTALRVQAPTMHGSLPNFTSASTLLVTTFPPHLAIRPITRALVISYILYRSIRYLASELPPLRSGLKRLPGPISTLPYLGRIHDVDRMRPWIAINKFSDQYNSLFALILVARPTSGLQETTSLKICWSRTLRSRQLEQSWKHILA